MGFKLTYKNRYTTKDQYKAHVCNKFIGFSVAGRATWQYAEDAKAQNLPVNSGQYCESDIVFVSINGKGYGTSENFENAIKEIDLALKAGATIITDNQINAERKYNNHAFGEIGLRNFLMIKYKSIKKLDMKPLPYTTWKLFDCSVLRKNAHEI
ncbi:MAG: hypothetical protein GZ094_02725 [Mariniphaga sp.]|nr:hypothetical protein [Mariniphaga sp.]